MSRSTADARIFSDAQRDLLRAVQNQLVPSEDKMPGAGDADGPAVVERFAALPAHAQIAALKAVERSQPGPFHELVRQTYNAYYTNPDVQQALGSGGPPQPDGFELEPLDEARLEGVERRGKRWRDA